MSQAYFYPTNKQITEVFETLEIAADRKLFTQVLASADTLEEDLRSGKLYSLDDAFVDAAEPCGCAGKISE